MEWATNGSGPQMATVSAPCKWGPHVTLKLWPWGRLAPVGSSKRHKAWNSYWKKTTIWVIWDYLSDSPWRYESSRNQPRRTNSEETEANATQGPSQHVRRCISGVTHTESFLRVQKCCTTTANTNNLCRNSIATGYDLQSLDFLGSCQQQVSFFWKPLTSFFILAKLKQYLF